MVADAAGNLYLADRAHGRIRKIAAGTNTITTIAGNGSTDYYGTGNYNGDNIPATTAALDFPSGLAMDGAGNLYIADTGNQRIRMVSASTGDVTTVAGNGYISGNSVGGYSGDGGAATSAELNAPFSIAVDGAGNLYINDTNNQRIRKVTHATGIITTVAGTSLGGYNGDYIAATSATVEQCIGHRSRYGRRYLHSGYRQSAYTRSVGDDRHYHHSRWKWLYCSRHRESRRIHW